MNGIIIGIIILGGVAFIALCLWARWAVSESIKNDLNDQQ